LCLTWAFLHFCVFDILTFFYFFYHFLYFWYFDICRILVFLRFWHCCNFNLFCILTCYSVYLMMFVWRLGIWITLARLAFLQSRHYSISIARHLGCCNFTFCIFYIFDMLWLRLFGIVTFQHLSIDILDFWYFYMLHYRKVCHVRFVVSLAVWLDFWFPHCLAFWHVDILPIWVFDIFEIASFYKCCILDISTCWHFDMLLFWRFYLLL
jgi:hypothetical protein